MKARMETSIIMDAYLGVVPSCKQEVKNNRYKTESVVRIVRDEMRTCFPQKSWDDLSTFERDYFIYVHIRGRMLRYIEKLFDKKIRDKIEKSIKIESKKRMLEAHEIATLHNEQVDEAFATYDTSAMPEKEAQELYKSFCCNMEKVNNKCPIPDYEVWRKDTRKHSMRPYDYIMDFLHEGGIPDEPQVYDVDHVVLHTLLKYLADSQGITIDIPDIKKCLTCVNEYNVEDFSPLDPESAETRHYLAAKEKLDNFDFIIKSDT